MITQTFHSVLARNCKISKSNNAVILSKMIFFLFKKKSVRFQYVWIICAMFQVDTLKALEGGIKIRLFHGSCINTKLNHLCDSNEFQAFLISEVTILHYLSLN